jgi:hypothetical protein
MDMYFFWGKDLLSEFSIGSILMAGLKTFFLAENLLFLPAWCFLICWFVWLYRAQFRSWRIFYLLSGLLACAAFASMVMLFLFGCSHVKKALPAHQLYFTGKSFSGVAMLIPAVLLLFWSVKKPRNKGLTGIMALICALLSGLAFSLSYVYLLTDDLQYLMRSMSDRPLVIEGASFFFAHAAGATLPLLFLFILFLIFFTLSKSRHYPPMIFSIVAFIMLLITGILTLSGQIGVCGSGLLAIIS